MGRPFETSAIGSPSRWLVVFDREASSWWASFVAFGYYKHVRAIGYVHDADAWLFYDVQFAGTILQIARGDGARKLMTQWAAGADVLAIDAGCAFGQKFGFGCFRPLICTTAVAHLLGLPGALLPDALYRQCLRHGATRVGDACHGSPEGAAAAARPDARPADDDGAASAGGRDAE
jgi:hypothetical protein